MAPPRVVAIRTIGLSLFIASSGWAATVVDTFACRTDESSRFPVPVTVPGLCVVETGSSIQIVQLTDGGLVVLEAQADPADLGPPNPDGTRLLSLHERASQVIYCPIDLVDRQSGAPSPECLADLASMSAGPLAYDGWGRAQASVLLSASGAAKCPSALHHVGSVTGPDGRHADLRSSLVLSPAGRLRPNLGQSWQACEAVLERVELTAPALAGQLDELQQLDWRLIEELVRMDEAEWELLRRLLALGPQELDRLQALVGEEGAALISVEGRVLSATGADDHRTGIVVTEGILDTILARVNDIRSRVSSLRSRTESLITTIDKRIPDRPDIVGLIDEFRDGPGEAEVIDQLRAMLGRVKPLLSGVLASIDELRLGFDEWKGGPNGNCEAGTDCGDFKADLTTLFADFREAAEFGPSLACLDKSGLEIRTPDTELLEKLVVEKAPLLPLYGAQRLLDKLTAAENPLEPGGAGGRPTGGWRVLIRDVLNEVSAADRQDLLDLCDEESVAAQQPGSAGPVCGLLRRPGPGLYLKAMKARLDATSFLFKLVEATQKDAQVTGMGAVVGGGGEFTFNVKNPPKAISDAAKLILETISKLTDRAIKLRDDCLASDATIEADLRACRPPVSLLVDDDEWNGVETVVNLRIQEVRDCQADGRCFRLCPNRAQCLYDLVVDQGPFPLNYKFHCDAYRALIGEECANGTSIQCCSMC